MSKISFYTEETFLKKLDSLYPNRDYKIISPFIRGDLRILIENEYGICSVIAKTLLNGAKGDIKTAVDVDTYRTNMFKEKHNGLYEYPNYKFTGTDSKITILCKEHGLQTLIESNHMKGFGCKDCTKKGTPRMKDDDFLQRVKDTGSGIEILGERGEYHTPILCRNKYGLVKISPDHLLKGSIGSLRSAVDKTSYMIEQFKEKHNNKYTYPNYEYCGNRCKGKIQCPIHGEFTQLTDVHLMGSGCSACTFLEGERINGYSRSGFIKKAKGRECTLYLVQMYNEKEKFYKIGISSHSTEKRFKKSSDVKYNINTLFEYKSFDAGHIWDLEKAHHRNYKNFHYKPEIYFKGITECFTLDLPIEEILSYLYSL